MSKEKQTMLELLYEVREWNKLWDTAPNGFILKPVDEFADELIEKYSITKN